MLSLCRFLSYLGITPALLRFFALEEEVENIYSVALNGVAMGPWSTQEILKMLNGIE